MRTARARALAVAALPLLLGTLAFLSVVGPRVLDPGNIAWLGSSDAATHYLGWQFFRNSGWSFPVGLNPAYGLELSNSIVFSDSNPLCALLFKPFEAFLPETFQYFGIWLYACFVLQAWFGWKLVGLVSENPALRLLAAGLLVFSPPMLWRLQVHLNLVGHFLILAALYLALRPTRQRRAAPWLALLAFSALVHAYFLVMVALLWLADLMRLDLRRERPVGYVTCELFGGGLMVGFLCWQAGYFGVGREVMAGGYGLYKMNLIALADASGWSYVVPDIPEAEGEYEGFNFLGLGGLFLILTAILTLLRRRVGLWSAIRTRAILLVPLLGLAAFAVSHRIGVGALQFELPLPALLNPEEFSLFRASGRLFWPAFYALMFCGIFVTLRGNSSRVATSVLAVALALQVADTSAAWRGIRGKLMSAPASAWASPLKDAFWTAAAGKYRKVRWMIPDNISPHWQVLAAFAGRHRLATDAVYLARVTERALTGAQARALVALRTGVFEPDALYVLDADSVRKAVLHLDRDADLVARIDGFYVLAPGWKTCEGCPRVADEVRPTDFQ